MSLHRYVTGRIYEVDESTAFSWLACNRCKNDKLIGGTASKLVQRISGFTKSLCLTLFTINTVDLSYCWGKMNASIPIYPDSQMDPAHFYCTLL